jgi:hypothetical protein
MNLTTTVGTPITLNATVANIGAGPTGAPFQTTFWTNTVQNESSGNQQYSEFTSGVPNGFPANYSETDGYQVPITRTFTSAGTYYYQVCANLDQNWNRTVTESNNDNNCTAWGTITVTYPPTGGSCTYSPSTTGTNMPVSWTASPTGGSGSYTYQWSGTGLTGTGQTDSTSYGSPGNYPGSVTISSAGTSATESCTPSGGGCQGANCPVVIFSCTPQISATPPTVYEGGSTVLNWTEDSRCASSCTVSNGYTGGTTGNESVVPPAPASGTTVSYSVTCGNPLNTASTQVTVLVPTASLKANPILVGNGGTSNLTYQCGNSTSGSISPAVNGTVSADGSPHTISTLPITSQTKYTLICSETSGGTTYSATDSVIVNVPPTFQNF